MARLTDTISGPIATFRTPGKQDIRSLKVHFAPVQEGTGDPSPDNVRPITWWTGIRAGVRGNNVLNLLAEQHESTPISSAATTKRSFVRGSCVIGIAPSNYYRANYANYISDLSITDSSLSFTSGAASGYGVGYVLDGLKPGDSVIFSRDTANTMAVHLIAYKSDGTFINYQTMGSTARIVPDEAATVLLVFSAGSAHSECSITNPMLELGSTATPYEPHQGTTLPVDWTDIAGTVYGGYVDLVTGEVVQEWEAVKIADLIWNNYSGKIHYYTNLPSRERNTYIYTDTLTPRTTGSFTQETVGEVTYYGEGTTATYKYIWTKVPEAMEFTEANEWIKSTYADAIICYKLETPIHYSLSPTILKTLRGTNNIWSNANGNVDVEYDFAESREMIEARKRVAGYSPWKLMWHNSFDKYQIWPSQTGSVFTIMDNGKWLKAVSNGQNKNSTGIYMNDRFLYNDVKDKLCRITYTIECDQSVVFDGTNTFGNITLGLLNTKTTPSTTAASTERVSKVDIVKQDTFIGHHSVEFVPSELFANLNKADYFGWNLGFRSAIDGITIRITQLDFEIKK